MQMARGIADDILDNIMELLCVLDFYSLLMTTLNIRIH